MLFHIVRFVSERETGVCADTILNTFDNGKFDSSTVSGGYVDLIDSFYGDSTPTDPEKAMEGGWRIVQGGKTKYMRKLLF